MKSCTKNVARVMTAAAGEDQKQNPLTSGVWLSNDWRGGPEGDQTFKTKNRPSNLEIVSSKQEVGQVVRLSRIALQTLKVSPQNSFGKSHC